MLHLTQEMAAEPWGSPKGDILPIGVVSWETHERVSDYRCHFTQSFHVLPPHSPLPSYKSQMQLEDVHLQVQSHISHPPPHITQFAGSRFSHPQIETYIGPSYPKATEAFGFCSRFGLMGTVQGSGATHFRLHTWAGKGESTGMQSRPFKDLQEGL